MKWLWPLLKAQWNVTMCLIHMYFHCIEEFHQPLSQKLSNFICEFVFIHMIKEWQFILCCKKFLCCPKELFLILAVFYHESHVKLTYCFIHYRSRFIFSLLESIQIFKLSRFDLTLCIPLTLWLISLLFLEVIGELFPISEWKSKHMLSGLWTFYRVR